MSVKLTDTQKRGIVLRKYYELRERGKFQWAELSDEEVVGLPDDTLRICDQLAQHGLIEWHPVKGGNGVTVGGVGEINANGVDVIERKEQPPIPITLNVDQSYNVNVSGSSQCSNRRPQHSASETIVGYSHCGN